LHQETSRWLDPPRRTGATPVAPHNTDEPQVVSLASVEHDSHA